MQSNSVETGSSQFTDENLQQNLHYIFFCISLLLHVYCVLALTPRLIKSVFTDGHLQQNLLYIFFCISLLLHVYWP